MGKNSSQCFDEMLNDLVETSAKVVSFKLVYREPLLIILVLAENQSSIITCVHVYALNTVHVYMYRTLHNGIVAVRFGFFKGNLLLATAKLTHGGCQLVILAIFVVAHNGILKVTGYSV